MKYENIKLGNDKVRRIINSAFKIFCENDIEKASTNMIVKDAKISRGLLYHYFTDKQDLFDFLLYFTMTKVVANMSKNINWDNTDFLDRMVESMVSQMKAIQDYPYIMNFFQKYESQINRDSLRDNTEKIEPGLHESFYTRNVDFTLFKDNIDIDQLLRVVRFTLGGLIRDITQKIKQEKRKLDINTIETELRDYICFFKRHFYK